MDFSKLITPEPPRVFFQTTCITCKNTYPVTEISYNGRYDRKCPDCSSRCVHGRFLLRCRDCIGVPAIVTDMIKGAKLSDKKRNKYDPINFVDKEFITDLFKANPTLSCFYCERTMTLENGKYMVTLERRDNSIGHTKSNCVLACRYCNFTLVGQGGRKLINNKPPH